MDLFHAEEVVGSLLGSVLLHGQAPFSRRALGEDTEKGDCGTPDPTSGGQIVPFIR